MESYGDLVKKFSSSGIDDGEVEAIIIALKKSKISSGSTKHKEDTPSMSGLKALELKSTIFYVEKIGLSPSDFIKSRKRYSDLGQYKYEGETYLENFGEKIDTNNKGIKYYYIGQFRKGTNKRDGVGISVYEDGAIGEGYYKNDLCHGCGRSIRPDGGYHIGDRNNGYADGNGEDHLEDGRIYKGQFHNGKIHGKGVLQHPDGTKTVGEWEEGNYIG